MRKGIMWKQKGVKRGRARALRRVGINLDHRGPVISAAIVAAPF